MSLINVLHIRLNLFVVLEQPHVGIFFFSVGAWWVRHQPKTGIFQQRSKCTNFHFNELPELKSEDELEEDKALS